MVSFLHLFVDDTSREQALEMFPDYIEKLFWGKKVAGLRVLLRTANSATVKGLVINAWKHKAPRDFSNSRASTCSRKMDAGLPLVTVEANEGIRNHQLRDSGMRQDIVR